MNPRQLKWFLPMMLVGIVFLAALAPSVSYCSRTELQGIYGGANDKKCKSYEACSRDSCGDGSCIGEENGVKCGSSGGKAWECTSQQYWSCYLDSSTTINGKQCRCKDKTCVQKTEAVTCGTHPPDCGNTES